VNEVVPFPSVAALVYIASLKVFPAGAVLKLCPASNNSFLKELVIEFVVIAIIFLLYKL
jgi:hypothetical protein